MREVGRTSEGGDEGRYGAHSAQAVDILHVRAVVLWNINSSSMLVKHTLWCATCLLVFDGER